MKVHAKVPSHSDSVFGAQSYLLLESSECFLFSIGTAVAVKDSVLAREYACKHAYFMSIKYNE